MIELYTWSTPNGRKISIALEEFGETYEVVPIDITQGDQQGEKFLSLNPNAKIPVIVDRERNRTVFESGAILTYLADKHGQFWGDDRLETMQWLMLQMASVGPMFGQTHHFLRYNRGKAPYAEARYHAETARLYGVLDARLASNEYLAGAYSIADMATWPWVSRFEWHEVDLASYAHVLRWYREIAARPAVQRGYDVPANGFTIPFPDSA